MQALTVIPGTAGSVELTAVSEPPNGVGAVLVEAPAVGVCGTDREIVAGECGEAPPDAERLVIGHESLGRLLEAPDGAGLAPGDLVAAWSRDHIRQLAEAGRSHGLRPAPNARTAPLPPVEALSRRRSTSLGRRPEPGLLLLADCGGYA